MIVSRKAIGRATAVAATSVAIALSTTLPAMALDSTTSSSTTTTTTSSTTTTSKSSSTTSSSTTSGTTSSTTGTTSSTTGTTTTSSSSPSSSSSTTSSSSHVVDHVGAGTGGQADPGDNTWAVVGLAAIGVAALGSGWVLTVRRRGAHL